MDGGDISAKGGAEGRSTAAGIPEVAEAGAALVGGVAAPEELTGHFVVEPGHVGLDEAGVALKHTDLIGFELPDSLDDEVGGDVAEGGVHGLREFGREGDRFEVVAGRGLPVHLGEI